MNIELIVLDTENNKKYDLSDIVLNLSWTTTLEGTAGQLQFTLAPSEYEFHMGSVVWLKIPGKADIFRGYIFTTSYGKERQLNVTAYDQTRYLKNADTYIFKNVRADEIFEKICKDFQLKYEVAAKVNYICSPVPHDNVPISEMIQRAIDETFVKTGEYLFVHDEFGTLKLDNLINYHRNYVFDKDLINYNFSYSQSIDEKVANRIKLVRNTKSGRQVSMIQDSGTVGKWGVLQHYEKITKEGTQKELDDRAEKLLQLMNKPVEKLTFTVEGKFDVFAGCQMYISLADVSKEKTNKVCIITSAKHTFNNNLHLMELTVRL